ncbi:MAG: hypothetical protein JKY04_09005 [Sneathiella sp.]|nr:hypothetical protein [Sneathiella sp.]
MNFVRNLILSLVVGCAVSLAATTTQASDFTYQFAGTQGTLTGVITIEDVGPDKNRASSITMANYYKTDGSVVPLGYHINFYNSHFWVKSNEFQIEDGKITSYELIFNTNNGLPAVNWSQKIPYGNFPPPNSVDIKDQPRLNARPTFVPLY